MNRRDFLMDGLAGTGLWIAAAGAAPAGRAAASVTPAARASASLAPATLPQSDERFESLAALVREKMEEHRIPGVALGVVKDGRTLVRGFGVTNVEYGQPVTPDTVFPIASISKTVAATALMRLVEDGKVALDAPVQTYLPDFRTQDERASREVTVRHLLTHTPGWEGQLSTAERGDRTLAEFTESLADLPQLSEPGRVWSYNNAGFGVAGRVIEVVTASSIHNALRDLVFAPLGLTHAVSRAGDALTYRFAAGHRDRAGATEVIRPFSFFPNVTAGGLAMSLESLIRYATFHLGEPVEGVAGVLPPASIERMRTPELRKEPTDDEMGVGWQLRRVGGVLTAAHGGTLGGHILQVQLVPERRLAFAILTNHSSGWRLIQDVERAALRTYEALALAPDQKIAHRGLNEDLTAHARALPSQPDPRPYLGMYRRPPVGIVEVSVENGALRIDGTPAAFYGPDVAFAVSGGRPYEFIRTTGGEVGWIRVNGRVARKDN
jgi:CubicO group peptidase (beta-lactamase class C family)